MDAESCSGWRQRWGGQIKRLLTSGGMCAAWCVGLQDQDQVVRGVGQ